MNRATAQRIIELDNRFYLTNANSFSATRQVPWQGWERAIESAMTALPPELSTRGHELLTLDLACGNMRLARFLLRVLPHTRINYYAIDGEPRLLDRARHLMQNEEGEHIQIHARRLDVLTTLLDASPTYEQPGQQDTHLVCIADVPPVHLACCFGFLHHIPGSELRGRALRLLVEHLQPGGIAIASFWQFMKDERIARKATETTLAVLENPELFGFAPDALEAGDYLLGWQEAHTYRYCHHFEEAEISRLITSLPEGTTQELDRYSADGRNGALNRYVILKRI